MAKILIAGGTGLVGERLSLLLAEKGHQIALLSRQKNKKLDFPIYQWDLDKGFIEEAAFQETDFIINLAGAGIADRPWTKARKQLIIDSRVKGAQLFRNYFDQLNYRPKAYLSSAAIGWYGDTKEVLVDEDTSAGKGFLAESCIEWEKAIQEITETGIRTIVFRIGIVLSMRGGALPKMKLPLLAFNGSYFGNGKQWYSWIHIDDMCQMFIWALENQTIRGTFNGVAPNPARNYELIKHLGKALGRPFIMTPVPAFALRLGMGEMADVVLNSTKVSAKKIMEAGFEFRHPELKGALKDLVMKKI